ncbi:MAG: zinc ribbon domain-containing protein [Acidimicrobiia bacterium]
MHSRNRAGEKVRKHPHYLKGTIFCARCQSRLSFGRSRGKSGGQYDYFFCLGRHQRRNDCDLPYIPVDDIEDAVAAYYRTIQLSDDTVRALHDGLIAAMRARTSGAEQRARQQRKRITTLEGERRKLLQAHLAGAITLDLLKEQQDRITRQLADAGAALAATEIDWETIETNIHAALGLATHFEKAYRRAKPTTRRHMNQAVFEAVHVDVEGVVYARLAEPFAQLLADDLMDRLEHELKNPAPVQQDRGSRKRALWWR